MSQSNETKPAGIKSILEEIDAEVVLIQKELSENELKVVSLKNQNSRLQSIFEAKVQQTERNLKLDMEAFELKIRGSFNAHNNMVRMLDKRLNEISDSQVELAETLLNINEKVNEMEEMIG